MNIAIIGCGYVGTAVARHWRSLNHVVTVTTTKSDRVAQLQEVAQRVVVATGGDQASLLSAIEHQDAVLLSVAPVGNKQVDADTYEQTYLHTAQNLVSALKQATTVKQLIYTSSCSVYGNSNGELVHEDSPLAPVNRQGEILRETEQVLLSASDPHLRVCILRLGGIYGAKRELKERVSRYAGTTLPGTGDNFTNWSHLDDIVSAIDFAIQHQCQGIYNLVNDVALTTKELFDLVCDRHHLAKVEWNPSGSKSQPYNVRVSNQKIKAAGYSFIHPNIEA